MSLPTHLSAAQMAAFGEEIDAIRNTTLASRGERDARYLYRLLKIQRCLDVAGRVLIYASLLFLPAVLPLLGHGAAEVLGLGQLVGGGDAGNGWWAQVATGWGLFWTVMVLGVLTLACAKILENMEIGHNISHAQWDWLRDPAIQSSSWEWDNVCPSAHWKQSHNVRHHAWTNVLGMDADVGGYGLLRLFSGQRWKPFNLGNPVYALLLALLFEWGIAVQELELGKVWKGRIRWEDMRHLWLPARAKMLRQAAKDYLLFPVLAGPFFLYVVGANVVANMLRNLWTYVIIFCGHFPHGVHVFTKDDVAHETRAGWYVRQLLGSCNIGGGRLFHIMSGNLSHQIEHHLFPDMPSNRYPEVAPQVRAVCARYGLPYNTGSLMRQFGTTVLRILRMSFPGHSKWLES